MTEAAYPPGIRSRFVNDINGLTVHVLEAGFEVEDQPCVLLLHGFPERLAGRSEAEVEACFMASLMASRQQEAKSFELLAATCLARLWREQGKGTEARDLLTPIGAWFTEGLETFNLVEARDLLEAL